MCKKTKAKTKTTTKRKTNASSFLQYRVGAFGFFYQGSNEAPGNMGLYDQVVVIAMITIMISPVGVIFIAILNS